MTGLLQGKVALISGAAHGIGAGVARQFVRHGARVLVTDVLDDEARALVEELNRDAQDSPARFAHLDVTHEPDWRVAVVLAEQAFGKLDTLINVAGVPGRAGIEQMTEPDWDRTVDTDLKGTWLGMKACIPAIRRAGGGAIVNTSSNYAIVGSGRAAAYHAAKAGVLMLSRTAAIEYARQNIRVNAVLPGLTDTPRMASLPADWRASILDATPMGRFATPDEIANVYVFLASDLASFVTGAGLVADGGFSAV
jgi:NAD(P)-dependent dehydrogenase (short-subunit alcohol dehydrogenase family)